MSSISKLRKAHTKVHPTVVQHFLESYSGLFALTGVYYAMRALRLKRQVKKIEKKEKLIIEKNSLR